MAPKHRVMLKYRGSVKIFSNAAAFSALENLSYEYCFYPVGWGFPDGSFL
jgi:hypothetical protein